MTHFFACTGKRVRAPTITLRCLIAWMRHEFVTFTDLAVKAKGSTLVMLNEKLLNTNFHTISQV